MSVGQGRIQIEVILPFYHFRRTPPHQEKYGDTSSGKVWGHLVRKAWGWGYDTTGWNGSKRMTKEKE